MATKGMRPVCAIYSTFLQRAYDQIIHDVALQNLPVTFCMDRAGLSHNDGPTHHGLFDIAYLRCVPNITLMQPKDEDELVDMLHTGLELGAPAFIRYPRGPGSGVAIKDTPERLEIGHAEVLREGSNIVLWALGPMVKEALAIADRLQAEENLSVGVVNARFIRPSTGRSSSARRPSSPSSSRWRTTSSRAASAARSWRPCRRRTARPPSSGSAGRTGLSSTARSVETLRAAHGLSPEDMHRRVRDRWRHLSAERVEADV
jgi:1-deoxy-D-xylulose-5-phosphate synthase